MINAYARKNGTIDLMTESADFPQLSVKGFIMVIVNRYANRANRFELTGAQYFEFGNQPDREEPRKC